MTLEDWGKLQKRMIVGECSPGRHGSLGQAGITATETAMITIGGCSSRRFAFTSLFGAAILHRPAVGTALLKGEGLSAGNGKGDDEEQQKENNRAIQAVCSSVFTVFQQGELTE